MQSLFFSYKHKGSSLLYSFLQNTAFSVPDIILQRILILEEYM